MIATWALALAVVTGVGGDELAHDDGKEDDRRSSAGGGHVVRFERPTDGFTLTEVRLHGSRYGGGYDPAWTVARVRVCDEAMQELAVAFVPFDAWKPGRAEWVDVPLAPLRAPEAFFVAVEYFPTQRKGIYQSIDSDASGHSFGLRGTELGSPLANGEWMIRAVGSKKALKVELPDLEQVEVVARGEGELIDKRSTAGAGHAVLFKQPRKKPFVTGFSLHGQRYGGDYDPTKTFFHVFVCDKKLKPLARTAFPYSSFGTEAMEWVDFDLSAVEVPKDFALLVYFDPTASRGVFVGRWAERKAASLSGLPGRVEGKTDKGLGWMIRARCAASLGKVELPEAGTPDAEEGLDALAIAELIEGLELAERAEDVEEARVLAARLAAAGSPEGDAAFERSEHFFLRSTGVEPATRAALLKLMESAHASLTTRFGFERVSAVAGRRIHLRLEIGEGQKTSLFTSPSSPDYSLIVMRGEERALRAPTNGGPHVVYGFCHELGHVLMGWEDSEHQWAHYVGSCVTSDVHAALGDEGWVDPYDYHALEGLPRFEQEIADAEPGTGDAASLAKLFHEVGARFGQERYGPALAWIAANREGEPFHAVRLYRLVDLAAALEALDCEKAAVRELFGD